MEPHFLQENHPHRGGVTGPISSSNSTHHRQNYHYLHHQTHTQLQPLHQTQVCSNSSSVVTSQFPTISQQILNQPYIINAKENNDHHHYQGMLAMDQNLYREELLNSKDRSIQTLLDNESYLRTRLGALQQSHKALETEVLSLRGDLQTLSLTTVPKSQYEEVEKQNREFAVQNKTLSEENGKLFGDSLILEQDNTALQNEKLKRETEKKAKRKSPCSCESLTQQNKQFSDKIIELEKDSEDNLSRVDKLEEKYLRLDNLQIAEIEELNSKLKKANDQKLSIKSKLNSATDENQNLSEKIGKLEGERDNLKKEKEQIKSKHQAEVGKLKEKLHQKRTDLKKSKDEFEKLKVEHEDLKKSKDEFGKLKVEHVDLKQAIASEQTKTETLQQQLDSEKVRAREANKTAYDQSNKMDGLKRELDELKEKLERKSKLISSLKRSWEETEKEEKDASAEVIELRSQVHPLKMENNQLNGQLGYSRDEISRLESEISFLNEKLETAQNDMEKTKELERQLEERVAQSTAQKEEIAGQQLVMALQKQCLDESDVKIEELEKEFNGKVKKLEEEFTEKAKKLEEQDEKIKILKGRVTFMVNQLKNCDVDKTKVERDFNKAKAEWQTNSQKHSEVLSDKENEIKKLCEQIYELDESLKKRKAENHHDREFISRILGEKAELQAKLRALPTPSKRFVIPGDFDGDKKKKINTMSKNNRQLRNRLEAKTTEIDELSHSLQKKLGEIQEANETIGSLRSQVTSLEERVDETREIIRRQRKELKKSKVCITELCMDLSGEQQSENTRLEAAISNHQNLEEISSDDDDFSSRQSPIKKLKIHDDEASAPFHNGDP